MRPEGVGWRLSAHTRCAPKLGGQLPAGLFSGALERWPARHRGAPGNQNQVSGEHLLCARQPGLFPPAVKVYYCHHVKGGNRLRGVTLLVPS